MKVVQRERDRDRVDINIETTRINSKVNRTNACHSNNNGPHSGRQLTERGRHRIISARMRFAAVLLLPAVPLCASSTDNKLTDHDRYLNDCVLTAIKKRRDPSSSSSPASSFHTSSFISSLPCLTDIADHHFCISTLFSANHDYKHRH